jgi:hypothetical protein
LADRIRQNASMVPTVDPCPLDVELRLPPGGRLVFVSDLHLTEGGVTNDFNAASELCQLAESLYRHPGEVILVLGGDVLDLLQVQAPREQQAARALSGQDAAALGRTLRRLAERPLSRTARQALGYKELLDAMEQGTPVAEALEAVVRRTRAYARRQLAWFRRDPRVRWSTLPPGPDRLAWALEMYGKG